jgi:hypothetical protein
MSWISQKVREMCDCLHSFSMTRECQQSLALERTGHTRFAAPSQPPERRGASRSASPAVGGQSGSSINALENSVFGTVGILGHRMSPGGSGEERSANRLRTGRCSMTGYRPTTTLAVVRRVRAMAREFRVKEPPAGPPTRAPHNVLLRRTRSPGHRAGRGPGPSLACGAWRTL